MSATETTNPATLEPGDFISIPAWRVWGCVVSVEPAPIGSDDARDVTIEEYPDQPASERRRYRLEPGEFEVED